MQTNVTVKDDVTKLCTEHVGGDVMCSRLVNKQTRVFSCRIALCNECCKIKMHLTAILCSTLGESRMLCTEERKGCRFAGRSVLYQHGA